MLPFTKKSCAAAEMNERRLYLTCRLTTGRSLDVRVTSPPNRAHFKALHRLFLSQNLYAFLGPTDRAAIPSVTSTCRVLFSSLAAFHRHLPTGTAVQSIATPWQGHLPILANETIGPCIGRRRYSIEGRDRARNGER